MTSNKSGRVLAAAALAAALCLAIPAEANDGRATQPGLLERLSVWLVETLMPSGPNGAHTSNPTYPPGDEDPEGCRGDYTACIDPNG